MNKKLEVQLTILSNQEPDNLAHQLRTDYDTALHIRRLIVNDLTMMEVSKRQLEKRFIEKLNALGNHYRVTARRPVWLRCAPSAQSSARSRPQCCALPR